MSYNINEHKHRLAYWATARAAQRRTNVGSVSNVRQLIEYIGLERLINLPDKLPIPEQIDKTHEEWRNKIVKFSAEKLLCNNSEGISHGTAAKIINVYLKIIFVCAGYEEHANVKALHPPIDRVLLKNLFKEKDYKRIFSKYNIAILPNWTSLSSKAYQDIINALREIQCSHNEPLWKIEKYWQPENLS